jgi:CHAT domain-containing protein
VVHRYTVLHLATHAVAGNKKKQSYIAFYPAAPDSATNLLYTEEIYNLSLTNTKLVILSACETAAGNLVKGEGIMSLSRAFAYAGCPNIITSLWKANDLSTAYLTTRIHAYLDKNYAIDEAVRQAKLDYLSDPAIHPRLKQPFYWAHLIFLGSHHPQHAPAFPWWLLAGFILVALLAFYLFRKLQSGYFKRNSFTSRIKPSENRS